MSILVLKGNPEAQRIHDITEPCTGVLLNIRVSRFGQQFRLRQYLTGLDHLNLASWSPRAIYNPSRTLDLALYCTTYNSYFPCGREAHIKHPDLYSLTSGGMIYVSRCQQVQLRLERTWQVCFRKLIPGWARKLSPWALQKFLVWQKWCWYDMNLCGSR